MEIEQLKSQWNDTERRVVALETKRSHRFDAEAGFNAIISIATLAIVGNFLGDNATAFAANPLFALPAVLVMLLAVCTLVMAVIPYGISRGLKMDGALANVQRDLIAYRKAYAWLTRVWVAILVPGWMVFPILGFQMLAGPKIIVSVNMPWIWGNVAFGVLLLAGLWLIPAVRRWFTEVSSGREQLRRLGLEEPDWR